MRELKAEELNDVSGGLDWDSGGLAIISIGMAGGPATALFGFAIGGAMLYVGTFSLSREF
jgi:hypothetical protein